MGLRLLVFWCKTPGCIMLHGPPQKELIDIIPPSLAVMPCDHGPTDLPRRFHGFLLRKVNPLCRRIPY